MAVLHRVKETAVRGEEGGHGVEVAIEDGDHEATAGAEAETGTDVGEGTEVEATRAVPQNTDVDLEAVRGQDQGI